MQDTSPAGSPAFRWLLAGTSVNSLGNAIAPVAIAFAVLDLGGSATQLGLVVAAYALANLLAVVAGGVLGDRFSRTGVMRVTNGVAGLVQAGLAASLLGAWSSLTLVTVAGVVNGALGALAGPATQAITSQTVEPQALGRAVTVRRLGQNVAAMVGFGAAGLLVATVGTGGALAVDAATFLLATGCFLRLQVPSWPATTGSSHLLSEAREGLRAVLNRTWLWSLIAMALVYHLVFGGAEGVLGPLLVGRTLGRAAWGYALAVMMGGFLLGGVLTLIWRPRRILLVGTLFLLLTAAFPAAIGLSTSLALLLLGAGLHGFGLEVFSVGWDLAIQEQVPGEMLSRVYSFDQLGSFLARPAGLALTGPVAALLGARAWLVVVAGVIATSALLALTVDDVRRLERRGVGHHGVV